MRKRLLSGLIVATLGTFISGCGSSTTTSMTEQQMDMVADYVASVVVRYDNNENSNKLVKLSETVVDAEPTKAPTETVEEAAPTQTPVQSGNTVTNSQGTNEGSSEISMEALYGLKDISVTYKDVKEYKTYPNDSATDAVTAANGKKFVAVTFTIKNTGSETQSVDLLNSRVSYILNVNSSASYTAAYTLLDNDMNYYQGKIKQGAKKEVVLLFEVEESLTLNSATVSAMSPSNQASVISIK